MKNHQCVICGEPASAIALYTDETEEIERPRYVCDRHYKEWKRSYDSKFN